MTLKQRLSALAAILGFNPNPNAVVIPVYFDADGNPQAVSVDKPMPFIGELSLTGSATEATLLQLLNKVIAAPATESKQDTGNTALENILAKIIAAPATESKQDTGNTALENILAKIIAAPATESKQDLINTGIKTLIGNRTVFDNQKAVSSTDNISIKFEYDRVGSEILTTGTSGTGTVSASAGQMVLNTGASNGVAVALSQDRLRYIAGHEFEFDITAEWDTGFSLTTGQFMFVGAMHLNAAGNGIQNGFGVGYYNDGTGTSFGKWRYKTGVLTFIKQANFDAALNTTGIGNTGRTWDLTEANKGAIFQGKGGFLGKAPLIMSINRGFSTTGDKLFAAFAYTDFSATKGNHLGNASLQVGAFLNGGVNSIVRIGSINGKVWATDADVAQKPFIVPSFTKSAITTEVPILALRNNATFNGLPNNVVMLPHMLIATQTSGAQVGTLRFYKGGSLTGGTFTAFSAESVSSYNTTATAFSGGTEVFPALQTWQNTNTERNLLDTTIGAIMKAYPGETITITAASGANMNLSLSAGIVEQF